MVSKSAVGKIVHVLSISNHPLACSPVGSYINAISVSPLTSLVSVPFPIQNVWYPHCLTFNPLLAADARTYYSRLQVNHGMDFAEAQKYRDEYIQGKKDAGLQVSDRNGFYISTTIKDQGKTGGLSSGCHPFRGPKTAAEIPVSFFALSCSRLHCLLTYTYRRVSPVGALLGPMTCCITEFKYVQHIVADHADPDAGLLFCSASHTISHKYQLLAPLYRPCKSILALQGTPGFYWPHKSDGHLTVDLCGTGYSVPTTSHHLTCRRTCCLGYVPSACTLTLLGMSNDVALLAMHCCALIAVHHCRLR